MQSKKYLFYVGILLLLAFIFNNFDVFLYPYNLFKDILYYPVNAIKSDELSISNFLHDSIIEGLKEDVEDLLKLNNMNLSLSDFNYIKATVIERNREYWYNTLTINKGKSDGVDVDMAVIDVNGLIGRISKVGDNWAIVKLITTNDTKNKVSAVIKTNTEKIYGIISGYDSKDNLLNLIITDNSSSIKKGDKVETTGMGGIFPSNILIGSVFDIIKDDDEVTNIVRVIPSSNIEGEKYVVILQRKEISNN